MSEDCAEYRSEAEERLSKEEFHPKSDIEECLNRADVFLDKETHMFSKICSNEQSLKEFILKFYNPDNVHDWVREGVIDWVVKEEDPDKWSFPEWVEGKIFRYCGERIAKGNEIILSRDEVAKYSPEDIVVVAKYQYPVLVTSFPMQVFELGKMKNDVIEIL